MLWGVNCGEAPYPGGYDWYPCQHERFIQQVHTIVDIQDFRVFLFLLIKRHLQDNGQWINNVTYCGGRHDKCDTNIIVTIANVSMPAPGVSCTSITCDNHHKNANKCILLAHFSIFKELFLLHLVQVMQLHLQHYKVNCNNH